MWVFLLPNYFKEQFFPKLILISLLISIFLANIALNISCLNRYEISMN